MSKTKKFFSCIIVLSMLLFTSCDSRPTLHELAREDADIIFELIKNKDIKQLSDLFSNEAKQKHNLEEEWQLFFESVDGNIEKYSELYYGAENEGRNKEGNLYKQSIEFELLDVKTDKGVSYDKIIIYDTFVRSDNPYREGLNGIKLKKCADDNYTEFIKVGCDE